MAGNDLVEHVEEIRKRFQGKTRIKSPVVVAQGQLPFWPDSARGLPNPLARSALFTVGNRNQPRLNLKGRQIASVNGVTLTYRGEELRQDDEDVFLQILHIARSTPLGDTVEFTAHGMLTELEWGRSKLMYERLKECLSRLSATSLTVSAESESLGFSGSLIRKFAWQGEEGEAMRVWRIWLEPELTRLFGPDAYTQVYWQQRLNLTSPLSRWLHGYYYTHAHPFAHKVSTLRELCGSRAKTDSDFRKHLRTALDSLVVVGFASDYEIDKADLVHITRAKAPRGILNA